VSRRVEQRERPDGAEAPEVGEDHELPPLVAICESAADQQRRQQADGLDGEDEVRASRPGDREGLPAERGQERGVADQRDRLAGPEQAEVAVGNLQGTVCAMRPGPTPGSSPYRQSYPPNMSDRLRVACVQMSSRADKAANLERAEQLVARAAATGADVVVLPEKWNAIGGLETLHEAAEPLEGGESVRALADWAGRHSVTIVGGSITERREGREKLSNTCVVLDRTAGSPPSTARSTCSTSSRRQGLPRVGGRGGRRRARRREGRGLAGRAHGLLRPPLPGALPRARARGRRARDRPVDFTLATGRDHWHVLLRTRAIENQVYVAAAAQVGEVRPGRPSYGRSLVADPWGIVLCEAPDEETIVTAELDGARLRRIRRDLPSLASRRPETYGRLAPR
jgi:predicted amidohydrolase